MRSANRVTDTELNFKRFSTKARIDKAINGLLGLVEGVALDRTISTEEIDLLKLWLDDWGGFQERHPFSEVIPVVRAAIADGMLTEEERLDLRWLCERLRSQEYFDAVTADMQRLHGVLGGVTADGVVSLDELKALRDWLDEHEHLRRVWPYDEIETLVYDVIRDQQIDPVEHRRLLAFFREFTAVLDDRVITNPLTQVDQTITGLCAMAPEISFGGSRFCFTGASSRMTRSGFHELVSQRGGEPVATVSMKLDYLVIGADGNPCWAYACYGRKVERAVELRKSGSKLLIVHENDFHDALQDPS